MRKRQIAALLLSALLMGGCARRPEAEDGPPPAPEQNSTQNVEADPMAEKDTYIRGYMEEMTLREKVGQLFFVRPDALDPNQSQAEINGTSRQPVLSMTEELRATLRAYPVGGVVLFGKNIASPEQVTALNAELQAASRTPLFLGVDEEGGTVARLANSAAFSLPRFESAAAVGAAGDPDRAEAVGRTIGAYLREYGFNLDFAPVADVTSDPASAVIGDRAFSSDAAVAALMAGAMARGLRQEGILPVYKHFPGHGSAAGDSHTGAAVSDMTETSAAGCEWLPYTENDLTLCGVMVGHISVPAITGDDTPASLSEAVVTGILRDRLGFDGVAITDSMAMGAVTAEHDPGEAAVLAVLAGCDMILMPNGLGEAFDGILDAVETGKISRERLDESVYRILSYKYDMGLL